MIILPRQARDKDRENSKKDAFFRSLTAISRSSCGRMSGRLRLRDCVKRESSHGDTGHEHIASLLLII